MVQAMVWLKLHLAWNSHYKFKFYFCLRVHSLHRWWFFFCLFFLLWFVKLEINRTKAELRSNQKTMGGAGGEGRGEKASFCFCLTLRGCINMIYTKKISPEKLPATQAKEFIITLYGKKIYTTCFRDLKIRKIFSNLFSI